MFESYNPRHRKIMRLISVKVRIQFRTGNAENYFIDFRALKLK